MPHTRACALWRVAIVLFRHLGSKVALPANLAQRQEIGQGVAVRKNVRLADYELFPDDSRRARKRRRGATTPSTGRTASAPCDDSRGGKRRQQPPSRRTDFTLCWLPKYLRTQRTRSLEYPRPRTD